MTGQTALYVRTVSESADEQHTVALEYVLDVLDIDSSEVLIFSDTGTDTDRSSTQ